MYSYIMYNSIYRNAPISKKLKQFVEKQLSREIAVELRRIDPMRMFMRAPTEPQLRVWVRAKGNIGEYQ